MAIIYKNIKAPKGKVINPKTVGTSPVQPTVVAWNSPSAGNVGSFNGGDSFTLTPTITVTNAVGSTVFSVETGTLPAGTSLNTATGVVSGTLDNTSGSYSFTIRAVNNGQYADRAFSASVTGVTLVSWTSPAAGSLGSFTGGDVFSFSASVSVTNASGSTAYSVSAGSLPAGTSLNSATGAIVGVLADTTASYDFTIRATNNGVYADREFTCSVGFTYGGSALFNGSNYLSIPSTSNLAISGNDCTVEFFFYLNSLTGYDVGLASFDSGKTMFYIYGPDAHAFRTPGTIGLGIGGVSEIISSSSHTVSVGQWYHVAYVRHSGTTTIYLNGTNVGSAADSGSSACWNVNSASGFYIGGIAGGSLDGYITNVRMVNGRAVYTSDFTPDTTPLTAVLNTTFLINMTSETALLNDEGGYHFSLTNNGSVAWSSANPFTSVAWTSPAAGSLGSFNAGDAFSFTANVSVTDPVGPTTYSVSAGSLPAGTSLDANTGAISGTLSFVAASYDFTIRATNNGKYADREFTCSVAINYGGSAQFNGSNNYLSVASSSSFGVSGDATWEAWIYFDRFDQQVNYIMGSANNDNASFMYAYGSTSGAPGCLNIGLNGQTEIRSSTNALSGNTWHHVAAVKNGSTTTLYVDGVSVGSGTANVWSSGSQPFYVGGPNSTQFFPGKITDVRFVNGTAVYTSNFVPPALPLTAITNTALLLDFKSNANLLVDSSSNNFTVTNHGATWAGYNPFIGGSLSFDGSSKYATTASSVAAFGMGDFTVEFWIYPNTTAWSGTYAAIWNTNVNNGLWIGKNTGSGTGFTIRASNVADIIDYATLPPVNTWTHVAFSRQGTTMRMFYNGTQVGTATSSNNFPTGTSYLGQDGSGNYFNGLLYDFRIVSGTSLYNANFTPPTTPLTAVNNTTLLLNALTSGNTLADSSSTIASFTNYGTTWVSNNPFTNGSVSMSGSGQYLTVAKDSKFDFGTGDFTVETWLNLKNATQTGYSAIYAYRGPSNQGTALLVDFDGNGQGIRVTINGQSISFGNHGQSAGSWFHLAVVRSSGTVTVYINGSVFGSPHNMYGTISQEGDYAAYIGANPANPSYYNVNAYMTNVRIANKAEYTTGFALPTSALAPDANTALLIDFVGDGNIADSSSNTFSITNNSATWSSNTPYVTYATLPIVPFSQVALLLHNDNETFKDYSSHNLTVGLGGGAHVDTSKYKFGNASVFIGSGGYIGVQNTGDVLSFGTNDFTVEAWIYLNDYNYGGGPAIMEFRGPSANLNGSAHAPTWYIGGGDGKLNWFEAQSETNLITSDNALPLNQWIHVAVSRVAGQTRMFVNGVQTGSTYSDSLSYVCYSGGLYLGYENTSALNGWIDEARIINGTGLYSGNFAVPTSASPNS